MLKPGNILIPIHELWENFSHERVTVIDVNQESRQFFVRWSDNPGRTYQYSFEDIGSYFKFSESTVINNILEHYGTV